MSKVLVVEDDKFLANAYRVKLTKSNFEVKIATDGDEGLAAILEFKPDVVILDLMMPGRDGFSVLQEMKDNPKYAGIPVVVATSLGQKEDTDKAMALGAKDYIIKSDLSINALVDKVTSVMGK